MADLTIAEAAERLGISKETLRTRVKRGQIPAHKGVDGQWRIVLSDRDATAQQPPEPANEPRVEPRSSVSADTGVIPPELQRELDALHDRWLLPMIDRITALERENGRLGALAAHVSLERERREAAERGMYEERTRREVAERALAAERLQRERIERERDAIERRMKETGIARLREDEHTGNMSPVPAPGGIPNDGV